MKLLLPESPALKHAQQKINEAIRDFSLEPLLQGGVLVALSGGADSVFLLYCLKRFSDACGFPLAALHVHHHLRGEEADRDADFCRTLCEAQGIRFTLCHADVPGEAAKTHAGIEETARRLRYAALRAALADTHDLSVIATAHNATDNAETVLLNLMRGGGVRALSGILPVRGDLVRPLLTLTKDEILGAVAEAGLFYVSDSTNADTAYARNYVRHEILPRLGRLTPSPEEAIGRMCRNLQSDAACLDRLTDERWAEAGITDRVDGAWLLEQEGAIRFRVLRRLYERAREAGAESVALEYTHAASILSRLAARQGDFMLNLPNRLCAVYAGGVLRFCREVAKPPALSPTPIPLGEGDTPLPGGFTLSLKREAGTCTLRYFSNLHRIDTKAAISSATLNGSLTVRARLPGDVCTRAGHKHKLRKLFNEKKIPPALRPAWPVVCDDDGILWVPLCTMRTDFNK